MEVIHLLRDPHQERFPYQDRVRVLHVVRLWSSLFGVATVAGVFPAPTPHLRPRTLDIGHWTLVIGHWSLVIDNGIIRQVKPKSIGSLFIGHCSLASAGLFLARVALEATSRPWPWFLVAPFALLVALTGFFLARRQAARLNPGCPDPNPFPALLLIYVFWPTRDPKAAASIALLAALAWLLSHTPTPPHPQTPTPSPSHTPPPWTEPLADGLTFAIALALYAATAARDVLPADFGEFQLVAAVLGVAHPFGFPLYTMMGHLFIRLLPWGNPAYRLNLMSGLLAAGTLVLVARATRLWARRLRAGAHPHAPRLALAGGLAGALALGTATTFWAQATIANVRTLAVFFAALALYALARFATAANRREADGALVLLGLALGLAGGHYPPLAFVSLFFVAYVLLVDPSLIVRPRRWWRPLLVGLLSFLLPLAYLPIRGAMGAPLAPENLDTLPGFLHHFLGLGFGGDMFAFANAADLPHRLALLPTLLPFQFNLVLLAVALLGLVGLLRRDWRLFVLLAGSLAVHTFVTITYRAPQTVEYLMPAYLPIAVAIGLLPTLALPNHHTSTLPHPHTPLLLCALILWAGLLNGWSHAPSFVELAGDDTARRTVEPLLEQAPADALILADWRWATPLWYLQQVEGRRPDVEVRYVYPITMGESGEEYWETWQRHVQEAGPDRPILMTHFYEFAGYTTEPWGAGFLIRPWPVTEPQAPLELTDLTFGNHVQLVGYNLRQDRFHPGQVAEIVLAWRATGALDVPPSFTLRLVDGEGHLRSQVDRALSTDVAPSEVRFERLALPLYPTLPAGQYQVSIGAYTVADAGFETLPTAQGQASATLLNLELTPPTDHNPQSAPLTLHRRSVPFSAGPTLVGVDYDRSVPDVLRIYLHWQCRPGRSSETCQVLQVRVRTADGLEATASLSSARQGTYQTVGMDLSDSAAGLVWLTLTDDQGKRARAAGPWGWAVGMVRLPAPTSDARFVPLGDEMAVVGFANKGTYRSSAAAGGEMVAVDVTLVALRPLTSDDATSIRLMDADGRWLARHDMQPALSAVPTLKWIRGSRVVDRHLLPLPEDFTGGELQAALVAYERFRMASLPPMDGRFAEVPLGTWTQPER